MKLKDRESLDKAEDLAAAEALTSSKNLEIMISLAENWTLGPNKAYDNNQKNDKFWEDLAKKWFVSVDESRRRSCANCEHGNISPEFLKAMEHVPYNKFDNDGGMRVWCDKFDFICHATRVCQAWEKD